jgi:hypothetical protein
MCLIRSTREGFNFKNCLAIGRDRRSRGRHSRLLVNDPRGTLCGQQPPLQPRRQRQPITAFEPVDEPFGMLDVGVDSLSSLTELYLVPVQLSALSSQLVCAPRGIVARHLSPLSDLAVHVEEISVLLTSSRVSTPELSEDPIWAV